MNQSLVIMLEKSGKNFSSDDFSAYHVTNSLQCAGKKTGPHVDSSWYL